ncbi:MAG: M13 family metallopeptidase [Candidatus Obscuribacterales bacterium]|nr:M13 family metallopeptidase [Candidatus Obscuribacterales bacterium]
MKSAKSILIALTLTLAPLYLISPPAALSDCGGDSEDCCKAKDEKGKDNKKAEEKVKDDTKSNTALLGKSGVNPDFMDQKALPGKDFYLYANGTWLKNTPIPDEYDKWGVLNIINDQNLKKLKNILEAAKANDKAEAGSNEDKIGRLYTMGMDQEKIDSQDLEPLKDELAKVDEIKDLDQLQKATAKLHLKGVNAFFNLTSGQDFKDSEMVIGQLFQGGLGLPDRDYYLNDDKESKELLAKYEKHVARMLGLIGEKDTEKKAATILKLETAMAKASMKNTDMRDPFKIYHKMSIKEIDELMPDFKASTYLTEIGHENIDSINVGQPDFLKAVNKLLKEESLEDWKTYLKWHLIDGTSPYLAAKYEDANFDFFGKTLTGKKVNLPRWKRVSQTIDRYMGEALGQLYVRDNFTPKAKEKAMHLVNALKDVLRDDLKTLEWMDEETRKNAITKLNSFGLKIGYPDEWRDYSKLQIKDDSYLANIFRGEEFEFHRNLDKIGKPVDRNEWFMSPQTVNAYYSPELNEIVFPAGILQPPIFDPDADDATNLGAMGMVIGHEMTHGFDDQGSKFDGKGNLKNWWSEADLKRFKERIALIETQYSNYKVGAGTNFKGKLVAGEAAADLGGLTIAHKALKNLYKDKISEKDENGFTPEQRFFLSFAQAWATNIRPEKERMMTAVDPHPTPHFRVNGTVANMDSFEEAFSLKDDSSASMMLPSDKRCRIW